MRAPSPRALARCAARLLASAAGRHRSRLDRLAAAPPFGLSLAPCWPARCSPSAACTTMSPRRARARDRTAFAGGRAAVAHIVGRDPDDPRRGRRLRAPRSKVWRRISPTAWWRRCSGARRSACRASLAYKAINTADSMIGHHAAPRRVRLGRGAPRRSRQPAGVAPGGAVLIARRCASRGALRRGAWRAMWRDAGKHRSPNAGWPGGGDGRRARPGAGRPARLWRRRSSTMPGWAMAARERDRRRHSPRACALSPRLRHRRSSSAPSSQLARHRARLSSCVDVEMPLEMRRERVERPPRPPRRSAVAGAAAEAAPARRARWRSSANRPCT